MRKFAIFQGALSPNTTNVVADVHDEVVTIDGVQHKLIDRFHPALVATMRACPADTQPGAVYDLLSDTYTNPEPVEAAQADDESGNGEPPPR